MVLMPQPPTWLELSVYFMLSLDAVVFFKDKFNL